MAADSQLLQTARTPLILMELHTSQQLASCYTSQTQWDPKSPASARRSPPFLKLHQTGEALGFKWRKIALSPLHYCSWELPHQTSLLSSFYGCSGQGQKGSDKLSWLPAAQQTRTGLLSLVHLAAVLHSTGIRSGASLPGEVSLGMGVAEQFRTASPHPLLFPPPGTWRLL